MHGSLSHGIDFNNKVSGNLKPPCFHLLPLTQLIYFH